MVAINQSYVMNVPIYESTFSSTIRNTLCICDKEYGDGRFYMKINVMFDDFLLKCNFWSIFGCIYSIFGIFFPLTQIQSIGGGGQFLLNINIFGLINNSGYATTKLFWK